GPVPYWHRAPDFGALHGALGSGVLARGTRGIMTRLATKKRAVPARVVAGAAAVALFVPLALGSVASASKPPNATVVMGTTDRIVSADPAGAYDLPSWTIVYNVYQTLLRYPPSSTSIVP